MLDAISANECLAMIRETLIGLGCCCPNGVHDETPPSCYPEWIACVVRKRMAGAEIVEQPAKGRE